MYNSTHPERVSVHVRLPLVLSIVVNEKPRIEHEEPTFESFVDCSLFLHVAGHDRLADLEVEGSSRDRRRHVVEDCFRKLVVKWSRLQAISS